MHSLPEHLERMKQALLHKKNKKAAWTVINEYFHFIGIESIKEELWILTKSAITNDLMDQSKKGADRHNLIFGYELLLLFFDAVKVLHDVQGIATTRFTSRDVVRHPLVARIVDAYDRAAEDEA